MSIDNDKGLPRSVKEWTKLGIKHSLKFPSIYSTDFTLKSASKIQVEQFWLLRAIYRTSTANSLRKERWFRDHGLERASEALRENTAWQDYLQSVLLCSPRDAADSRPYDFACCGHFSMAHYYQVNPSSSSNREQPPSQKITLFTPVNMRTRSARYAARGSEPQTPTRAPKGKYFFEYMGGDMGEDLDNDLGDDIDKDLKNLCLDPQTPTSTYANRASFGVSELTPTSPISIEEAKHLWRSTEDEQIISNALILLLNALSMCCKDVTGHWAPERKSFTLAADYKRGYEARVDGIFRTRAGDVKAIVEVKACVRGSKSAEIRMQETAQMAAWICSDPPSADQMRQENRKEK
ncbi:hypothetical protein F5Y07DRAFT_408121 [Xylaria sp. FL0933]|nr:hypothetical protein F5Y07DRAFT_408121 [Xylaria sp. FL0933]